MTDPTQQPIIVKRIKKSEGGAHGGAWKLAYADFVTAMMAFFLLMWLLSTTADGDLRGISDYFKAPAKLAATGGHSAGSSSSLIPGGGEDLTRVVGQMAKSDLDHGKKRPPNKITPDQLEELEKQRFQELKKKIESVIEASAALRQFKKQLLLDITSEGLRIQIVDEQNRPMFDLGASTLKPYTREILHAIGDTLNGIPNRISISGHTDATSYAGGEKGFSNWELSADRANACRRELLVGGLTEPKVARVVGLAQTIPLDTKDMYNSINRRISIVVMNKRAEADLARDSRTLDADASHAPSVNDIRAATDGTAPSQPGAGGK